MRIALGWILRILGIGLIIFGLYAAFLAYFVTSISRNGNVCDGFGREVYEAPVLFRLVTRQAEWPGLMWFVVDGVLFFLTLAIVAGLLRASSALLEQE